MKETILHHVWQYKLFSLQDLKTTQGQAVEVIDVGKLNTDAGPDFFNAKIRIDGTVWAGNIEIHRLSSDWKKHKHDSNKAYDNVILHVVGKEDEKVYRQNGEEIPQLELQVPKHIQDNYQSLFATKKWVACEDKINEVPSFLINSWKSALLVERLERKANGIDDLLTASNNHWEEAFYVMLARSFGFGTNSQAFEMTAKSLPLNVLGKHHDNLFQLEALLFGQAGLLDAENSDNYQSDLRKEYQFLKIKYKLQPIDGSMWKLLRLRPDNFPHVRIAQFAALTYKSSNLFSKIIAEENVKALRMLFECEVSDYWQKHYLFGTESPISKKRLGKASIDVLLINAVVPFVFNYYQKRDGSGDRALKLLEEITPEVNTIIKNWKNLGVEVENAFDTQALLQLKKEYCDEKKCLCCRIGHKVLSINPVG